MEHKVVSNHILVTEIDRLVNEGTQVTFVPKGNSMLPFIRGGRDSVALMKDADVAPLDIVLAKVGKTYVIHRVIKIDGDRITLMGDGNICGTEQCGRDEVIAKAVRIIKGKKQIDCTGRCHRAKASSIPYSPTSRPARVSTSKSFPSTSFHRNAADSFSVISLLKFTWSTPSPMTVACPMTSRNLNPSIIFI